MSGQTLVNKGANIPSSLKCFLQPSPCIRLHPSFGIATVRVGDRWIWSECIKTKVMPAGISIDCLYEMSTSREIRAIRMATAGLG